MLSSGVLFTMLLLQGMAFLFERAFGLAAPTQLVFRFSPGCWPSEVEGGEAVQGCDSALG